MFQYKIIEVTDESWSNFIGSCIFFDFYHTKSYHSLEKGNRPILFVVYLENNFIAIPFVIRKIPNSDYFDCTSAYGYCGPISNINLDFIKLDFIQFFQYALLSFFQDNKIITAFSRLHPLISYGKLFENFGLVRNINKTVTIDLRLSTVEQRSQYRKSNKSELNQLRKRGFQVAVGKTKDDIDEFISIYHETMIRVNASQSYFFDHKYFYDFLNSKCFNSVILLAKKDGVIAAGAIFTITNKIMQYHLAGTKIEFIKETPMKLILDEARLMGNELNLDFLHLGGGVGGSDDDSLFRFKSGFSNFFTSYETWQMVVDQNIYTEINEKLQKDVKSNFFPLYRST
ncbi:hypothetical protein [Sediminibacterium sp.]|uniref:hypothetical protein n=1 Tax=Sediminibacterium sp. TaxID=1917865 RepID=UPI003F72B733